MTTRTTTTNRDRIFFSDGRMIDLSQIGHGQPPRFRTPFIHAEGEFGTMVDIAQRFLDDVDMWLHIDMGRRIIKHQVDFIGRVAASLDYNMRTFIKECRDV